jgi:O-antigen ligase
MMMVASRPLSTWFTSGEAQRLAGSNEAGSELDRWALTILATLAIIVVVHRRVRCWDVLRQHKWLVVLLFYMFLSTFWSAFTLIALRRWVRETLVLMMALLLLSETNPRKALVSVLRRSAYVLIPFSLVLIKYFPLLGRMYGRWSGSEMWIGVTSQKNQLGRLCMIAVFFLLWEIYRRWREHGQGRESHYQTWADAFVLLLALLLLKGSDSFTSMTTLLVGIATYFGLRLFRQLRLAVPQAGFLAVVVFLMAFGTATPFLGGTNVASFSLSLGRDSTLTGRTEVWAEVLPAREEQPLLGYGLGSFWTDARRQVYEIPTAHNGYLDILLELGEAGLALYVIWLLACARQLHRALLQDQEWASFAIGCLLMNLVYNISESSLNSFTQQTTALMTLVSLVVLRRLPRGEHAHLKEAKAEAGARSTEWDTLPGFVQPADWSGSSSTVKPEPFTTGFVEEPRLFDWPRA